MNSTAESVSRALPLRVEWMRIDDPVVYFGGVDWSLAIVCPWQLLGAGLEFDWEKDPYPEAINRLRGLYLREVVSEGDILVDPVFRFDEGISIAIRADSDLDPWVLTIPDLVVVGRRAPRNGEMSR